MIVSSKRLIVRTVEIEPESTLTKPSLTKPMIAVLSAEPMAPVMVASIIVMPLAPAVASGD